MDVSEPAPETDTGAQSSSKSRDTVPEAAKKKSQSRTARTGADRGKGTARSTKGSSGGTTRTARTGAPRKPRDLPFSKGDYVVYPSHGVGQVTGVERARIADVQLHLFVVYFASDKMTLRVPVDKALVSGLRKISSQEQMQSATEILKGRPRAKRSMWSRRAQEYEAKINSGDPIAVAEVVRDLFRAPGQQEQSYSERQMYEAALDRLVNEFALVEQLDLDEATARIESILDK